MPHYSSLISRGGVEGLQVLRLLGPAKHGEGEQPGGEPRVQHIRVLLQLQLLITQSGYEKRLRST
jgi:hypothetical protein